MQALSKSSKGSVGIESFQGRLRLRLPRQLFDGKQKYLTLGLDDNTANHRIAETKASEIEKDIIYGCFDPTLDKYRNKTFQIVSSSSVTSISPIVKLDYLWDEYVLFKVMNNIQKTTVLSTYRRIGNHIKSFPTQDCNQSKEIVEYLLTNKTPDTAKRVLIHLSACCNWAVENKHLVSNPFIGLAEKIQLTKVNYEEVDPFTVAERDAIIKAFETSKYYSYYTPFVKFLFFTGCRTGEAVGLQWKHITKNCEWVVFSESFNSQHKIRKDTKTHRIRRFPCNDQLKELLLSIRPDDPQNEELVFKSKNGGTINSNDFMSHAWKGYKTHSGNQTIGIVTRLVNEGVVERYRPQYNTRHTFITMAIEAGIPVNQVAKWVGNSVDTIHKHYVGNLAQIQVPIL